MCPDESGFPQRARLPFIRYQVARGAVALGEQEFGGGHAPHERHAVLPGGDAPRRCREAERFGDQVTGAVVVGFRASLDSANRRQRRRKPSDVATASSRTFLRIAVQLRVTRSVPWSPPAFHRSGVPHVADPQVRA
jgi:hypothetical protein